MIPTFLTCEADQCLAYSEWSQQAMKLILQMEI